MLEGLIKDFLLELQLTGRSDKTVEAYKYHLEKFAHFCKEMAMIPRHQRQRKPCLPKLAS